MRRYMNGWLLAGLLAAAPLWAQDLAKGIELCQTGQHEQAATELQGVIDREPANAEAHYHLGMALVELSRLDEAQREFDAAREHSVGPDRLKVAEARLHMERKEMDEALTRLNEAQELNAENADVYYYRGLIQANRQNFAEAATNLDKTITLNPRNAQAHYYAGMAYNRTGRPDKMVDHFKIFLELAPNSPDAPKVRSLLRSVR